MTNCNCRTRFDCTTLAIMASLVIGIATAILRFTAIITVPAVFLWVTFGIAVAYLAVVLVSATAVSRARVNDCVCNTVPLLLLGILVTILTSVILLAVEFAATSVLGAIITGALLTAFSLIFTTAACFVRCVTNVCCDED